MVKGGKKGDKNESILGKNSIIKSGQSRNTKIGGEQWREESRELIVMEKNTKNLKDQGLGLGGETKRIKWEGERLREHVESFEHGSVEKVKEGKP